MLRLRLKRFFHDLFRKHEWYYVESEMPGSESEPGYSEHYDCDICGDEYIVRHPAYFYREIERKRDE